MAGEERQTRGLKLARPRPLPRDPDLRPMLPLRAGVPMSSSLYLIFKINVYPLILLPTLRSVLLKVAESFFG